VSVDSTDDAQDTRGQHQLPGGPWGHWMWENHGL